MNIFVFYTSIWTELWAKMGFQEQHILFHEVLTLGEVKGMGNR